MWGAIVKGQLRWDEGDGGGRDSTIGLAVGSAAEMSRDSG